ncbi:Rpn family recombination-promoting nuclease/putative transposase [Nocardia sp. NPDC058497]|uniref:Rpn family recombination-promoting nuclease/putative transposase n=1 Tax=Nocardia sp. NPDC058497 TaxID=3346529 RepID=UPI0036684638
MADGTPNTPHDKYFREVMSDRANAVSELRTVVPAALARELDWDTLRAQSGSLVSAELQSRFTDILYRVDLAGSPAYVFVLIEHQSRSDPLMAFRLLEYVVLIWGRHLKDNPKRMRLPAVIPLVVHAGTNHRRWSAPLDLADLIDVDTSTRGHLGSLLPRFRYLLDDLHAVDVEALLARPLVPEVMIMLVLLKAAPTHKKLDTVMSQLEPQLKAVADQPGGAGVLYLVMAYALAVGDTCVADLQPLAERLGPRGKEALMTGADRLRAEGRVEGRTEGEAKVLIRQLTRKFGIPSAEVADTVRSASIAQLELWTDRILTATTLDEVFAP